MINSIAPSSGSRVSPCLITETLNGETYLVLDNPDTFPPFFMSLASDRDHWLFIASNGGLAAGREHPDKMLFPYYTHDKIIDLAGSTGALTGIRIRTAPNAKPVWWQPWDPTAINSSNYKRRLLKHQDGGRLIFEEINIRHNILFRYSWSFSDRFGFLRETQLVNLSESTVEVEIMDGIQNLIPPSVDQAFQNHFSNLADGYKRCEWLPETDTALYYLSSIPTDKAEPSEGLRATVVWSRGLEESTTLLSTRQWNAFRTGKEISAEYEIRGQRGAFLKYAKISLAPTEEKTWLLAADTPLAATAIVALQKYLHSHPHPEQEALKDSRAGRRRLRNMVAAADGLQLASDQLRPIRHFANVLYNIQRGGIFTDGYKIPLQDFLQTVQTFNNHEYPTACSLLKNSPAVILRDHLISLVKKSGSPSLIRLACEYLPITFSRRHGDPSRPWNRFHIDLKDSNGNPRLAYQGNWRDIFQNWESLLWSYPHYIEGAIARFLNATTAEGYNPYRITKNGFEWEEIEPGEPWANIGYWGDHQIIYLLKLLELSERFFPGKLAAELSQTNFAYAFVPYRIRPYADLCKDPRTTVDYDYDAARRIAQQVQALGADGKLLTDASGEILHVSLIEKLLVPLLSKLSNFVADGGIWMNTQRPEWNDANNALVGYGVSVVTLGYLYRYIGFLIQILDTETSHSVILLTRDVARWQNELATAFTQNAAICSNTATPAERKHFLTTIGHIAESFRNQLYASGLRKETAEVQRDSLLSFLQLTKDACASSLRRNQRSDGLFHSYNLLNFTPDGIEIEHLDEMLEGQVSILHSSLLSVTEAARLVQALRSSRLYREDQSSYTLYPDKVLPAFLDKNTISRPALLQFPDLCKLADLPVNPFLQTDPDGNYHFSPDFRNVTVLRQCFASFSHPELKTQQTLQQLETLYEQTFNHRAFTGRSGTFFAYEGLGSIYWHMVSKLVLAVQDIILEHPDFPSSDSATRNTLIQFYRETREGLGLHKSPELYGAFPTDPYSHTPRHSGAQQPGMTGQVKEDILVRRAELGIQVRDGKLLFQPTLLQSDEFLTSPSTITFPSLSGEERNLQLQPASCMASFCQIPVIIHAADRDYIELHMNDGGQQVITGHALDTDISKQIFSRTSGIAEIHICFIQ